MTMIPADIPQSKNGDHRSVNGDIPPRPVALPVLDSRIPAELKALAQWVVWKYIWKAKERKWDKPLFSANTGKYAKSNDPRTWSPFDAALAAYHSADADGDGAWDGVGFVPQADNGL